MGLSDDWKKIRSNYQDLASQFKPDLGPLVAKFDADSKENGTLDGQAKKSLEELRSAMATNVAIRTALAPIFVARDKALVDINAANQKYNDDVTSSGDDFAKTSK